MVHLEKHFRNPKKIHLATPFLMSANCETLLTGSVGYGNATITLCSDMIILKF